MACLACLPFTWSLFCIVLLVFTFQFVVVLFMAAWCSFADFSFMLFFLCPVCISCILGGTFLVWTVLSFRLLGVCRALLFKSAVAVWLVFGFTLTRFTTVVFFDFCLKVFFFIGALAACLFSALFFLHGFNLFVFLTFLSEDFHFGFTAVLVVATLTAVVLGLTRLLVTGGLVVSLNFLGGGLVGFSFVSSTVTEMAQTSVRTHFHSFTCSTLPHMLHFIRLVWIFGSKIRPKCLTCFPLLSLSFLSMFDVKWVTTFYSFIYDLSAIIQFGSIQTWNGEKKAGSAPDKHTKE